MDAAIKIELSVRGIQNGCHNVKLILRQQNISLQELKTPNMIKNLLSVRGAARLVLCGKSILGASVIFAKYRAKDEKHDAKAAS